MSSRLPERSDQRFRPHGWILPALLLSRTLPVVSVLLVVTGCMLMPGPRPPDDRDRITRNEILQTDALNAYQAIVALRPNWLHDRGATSILNPKSGRPHLYVDGSQVGPLDDLVLIQVTDIREVRFWSPGQAGARFGMGHPRGVIEVIRAQR